MIATLRRFFDDAHRIAQDMQRIADCISANRHMDVEVTINPHQIQDLPFYRRRQAKKVQA